MHVLLPTAYLPGIDYMGALLNAQTVEFEACEHFVRQTYRSRTRVLSPNGILTLSIPVVKVGRERSPVRDARISYEFGWQRIHWLSLESCYRRSAWFEFFEDQLRPFYLKKQVFLFDYNLEWISVLCQMIGVPAPVLTLTSEYHKVYPPGVCDLRSKLQPKMPLMSIPVEYRQTFSPGEFVPGLSLVDLLMNEGRASAGILARTWQSLSS